MVTHTVSPPASGRQDLPATRTKRLDIQGLRALAVVLVVLFHLWPNRLTGGYVGVDVFFVISGFLITAHLLGEVDRTGTVSLSHFWARRIRRLLPAALTVLAASLIAAFLIVPKSMLQQALSEIAASTVYAQNWLLASDSIDYLAAENNPSLVQHYWSLSVEEQFYIVWPILIIAALWVARKWRTDGTGNRRAILIALAVVFGTSLVYSIYATAVSEASAYFITPTRAWEFAAGALVAFLPTWRLAYARYDTAIHLVLGWGGILLIGVAAVTFDADTAFPGYLALVPVAGAVMILCAGEHGSRWSTSRLFNLRPVQVVGDLSYSIYLWHWPLVVLFPFVFDTVLNMPGRLAIIVLSVALAWLTKKLIEDPARLGRFGLKKRRATYGFAAAGMLVLLAGTGVGTWAIADQQRELDRVAATTEQCLGASAQLNTDSEVCADFDATEERLFPTLTARSGDTEGQYKCYVNAEGLGYIECTQGDAGSDTRIAITGDSHAASLVPGLVAAAEENGWAVDVLVGNGCQLTSVKCGVRDTFDDKLLNGDYDLVLVSGKRANQPEQRAIVDEFTRLADAGVRVVPIVDVPIFTEATDACVVQSDGTMATTPDCSTPREEALAVGDTYERAADELGLPSIDLTDIFCGDEICPAVIGHSIVYRDTASHITATFSRSLKTALSESVGALLPAP
jgi:peptidoglycan/LPS O-acetylase OafA/YrhL